jgi:hypothetical protein
MMHRQMKIKVLRGALEVLDGGRKWIQGHYALNGGYCLSGAMFEAACQQGLIEKQEVDDGELYVDRVFGLQADELEFGSLADRYTDESSLTALAKEKGFANVPKFNDAYDTTYADVERFVNERIALLESET